MTGLGILGFAAAWAPVAWTADSATPTFALKIHEHRFTPAEVEVPAGQKVLLEIDNQDATAEEFDSHALHREKIIAAHSKTNVFIGPLKPGRYEFIGEFNEATARGAVIAR